MIRLAPAFIAAVLAVAAFALSSCAHRERNYWAGLSKSVGPR